MWRKYHSISTTPEYKALCKQFLKKTINSVASPTFYHYTTDVIFQQLMPEQFPLPSENAEQHLEEWSLYSQLCLYVIFRLGHVSWLLSGYWPVFQQTLRLAVGLWQMMLLASERFWSVEGASVARGEGSLKLSSVRTNSTAFCSTDKEPYWHQYICSGEINKSSSTKCRISSCKSERVQVTV